MSFSRITIFVVITAVAVYIGLNLILPHRRIEPKLESGPSPEQVFSSSTSTSAPGAASPNATGPAEVAPAATSSATPAVASETTDSSASESTDADNSNTASEGNRSLTEAEARKIAEDVGRKVATQVAQQLIQQRAVEQAPVEAEPKVSDEELRRMAQTEVQKAVASKPAAAAPAAAAPPPPKTVKAPAAKPAPVQSAAVEPAHSASAATSAKKPKTSTDDAITAWWAPNGQPASGQLGLSFAGEAASERAVALLFTAPFNDAAAAAASSHIEVLNAAGKPVGGRWMLAPNPRMLVLRVAARGRYTVIVDASVADAQGSKLAAAVHGPVYVH